MVTSSAAANAAAAAAASASPLPSIIKTTTKPRVVRALVFDLDGTLTKCSIDFVEMRRRAGVPPGADILETIENIADPAARAAAHAAIEEVEREGLARLAPARGLHAVLTRLDELGLPRGLVTRNNKGAVEVFHEKLLVVEEEVEEVEDGGGEGAAATFVAVERETTITAEATTEEASTTTSAPEGHGRHKQHHHSHHHHDHRHGGHHSSRRKQQRRLAPFYPALARDFKPPKPAPAALLACAEAWGVPASEVVMVGDSLSDDVVAGNRAGAHTILLDGRGGEHEAVRASFVCEETTPTAVATSLEGMLELLESAAFELRPPPKKEEEEEK